MPECIVILATFSTREEAHTISQILLEEKVVACANIIDNISSHFWWQGAIEGAREVLLITKTEKALFKQVESIIKKKHSYEVPEIIALPIIEGHEHYVNWIHESVQHE